MGRTGETIDAAMLAAAIGIDRAVEGDVGRIVAGDDRARLFHLHLGAEGRQVLQRLPAVVEIMPRRRLEASGRVDARAASAPASMIDAQACLTDHRIGVIRASTTEGSHVGLLDDICLLDHFHFRLPEWKHLALCSHGESKPGTGHPFRAENCSVARALLPCDSVLMNLFLSQDLEQSKNICAAAFRSRVLDI
jgi:hypothetical protein